MVDTFRQEAITQNIYRITSNSIAKTSIGVVATNLLSNVKIVASSLKELSRLLTNRGYSVSYSTIQRYLNNGKGRFIKIEHFTIFN